jgi:hypothetical protein
MHTRSEADELVVNARTRFLYDCGGGTWPPLKMTAGQRTFKMAWKPG